MRPFEEDPPSLWRDLVSGEAGALPRIALSLSSGLLLGAAGLLGLWVVGVRYQQRISDSQVALTLAGVGLVWCLAQIWIWSGYARYRLLLNGVFSVAGIWAVVIPLGVWIDEVVRREEELLIAGAILGGAAATVLRICVLWHRGRRGRRMADETGRINVNCPECGYSMVGLSESRCPECGTRHTLDELIRLQGYDALRRKREEHPRFSSPRFPPTSPGENSADVGRPHERPPPIPAEPHARSEVASQGSARSQG